MHIESHFPSFAESIIFLDGLPTEGVVPPPFTTADLQSALNELPEGARLAVQTCLDLWREKVMTTQLIESPTFSMISFLSFYLEQKFGTQEFVSFIKCYSKQSRTIASIFPENISNENLCDSMEGSDALSCKSTGLKLDHIRG
jgi:hypothetical protein